MNKQLLAFNVMTAVQTSYTAEGMSDSKFAEKLTHILGTDVTTARVRQARNALGIANNVTSPEAAELTSLRAAATELMQQVNGVRLNGAARIAWDKLAEELK